MAQDTTDPRPRRRLFGRRRSEGNEPPPNEAGPTRGDEPVTIDEGAEPKVEPPATEPEPATVVSEADVDTDSSPAPATATLPAPEAATKGPSVAEPAAVAPPGTESAEVVAGGDTDRPMPALPDPAPEGEPVATADEEEQPMVSTNPQAPLVADDVAHGDAGTVPGAVPEAEAAEEANPDVLPLPRVIAIANQKGGVGKTTTAVNLGAALAEAGYRVLVVDLDPQGNASTGLGISPRDVENSVYDVIMTDTPALDCIEPTSLKNLFVLPATIDLAGAEIELVAAFSRELKLRRALEPVRAEYDLILIDCPPSLGLLTVNGLAAADDVIVPVQSEYYALEGLGQLLKNVAMVRSVNPTLDVRGIVLTMHDARTKLAEQVELEVREHFGAKVYKTAVPRNVRLAEAPSFGQPIIAFDPASRGAWAYRDLAKEVTGGATRRSR
jgi:chromosome partitioning protein